MVGVVSLVRGNVGTRAKTLQQYAYAGAMADERVDAAAAAIVRRQRRDRLRGALYDLEGDAAKYSFGARGAMAGQPVDEGSSWTEHQLSGGDLP